MIEVSRDTIVAVLRESGVSVPADLRLEPVARNAERRDYLHRADFRVYAGKRGFCQLSVARDLQDLARRAREFAEACPEIACRTMFHRRAEDWEFLGFEYFEGDTLEHAVAARRLKSKEAVKCAEKVLEVLEKTKAPSTREAVAAELDRFFERVSGCALFSGLDQKFLRDLIFPFVRTGALAELPPSRWTNGDLVPRNILVNQARDVRLVDYEFAERTHFFGEEWWRWRTFTSLPAEARDLPSGARVSSPWLEAIFWLRQLVLVHEFNGAQIAVQDAEPAARRLMELTAQANAGFRSSVFYRNLFGPVGPAKRR